MTSKALVVLSGGQDSTTCLYIAKQKYDEVHAVTFDYGQRHARELAAAAHIGGLAGVASHEIIRVPDCLHSMSPLTSDATLEQYENHDQMEKVIGDRVELTFVPMRNTLFFTIAYNRAVERGVNAIYTGICEADNANYPDCTDSYRHAFERMANFSLGYTGAKEKYIHLIAPLMQMSKSQSVKLAVTLPGCMEVLAYSHTSYDGQYPPTDMNHANVLRAKGFEDAGWPDPLVIRAVIEGKMPYPQTGNYSSENLQKFYTKFPFFKELSDQFGR